MLGNPHIVLNGDHGNKGQKLRDFCDKRLGLRELLENELHKEAHLYLSTNFTAYKRTFIKCASVMCMQGTECF